jgi:hypothetical protein
MDNKNYIKLFDDLSGREKLSLKFKHWFDKTDEKLPVIQIGVGGLISSGKTVLIDALFSLFDNNLKSGYMPKKFSGLYTTERFDGSYESYSQLRSTVSSKFHTDNKTLDNGAWNQNTYVAKLRFCKKDFILLIRNLPGEVFNRYFVPSQGHSTPVKLLLENYLLSSEHYKEYYKDIFTFKMHGKKNNKKAKIAEVLDNIRDNFIADCLGFMGEDEKPEFIKNFYALMFYLTSDYHIHCIKSEDKDNFDNSGIFPAMRDSGQLKRYVFCYTQFDTLINSNKLPEPGEVVAELTFLQKIKYFIRSKGDSNIFKKESNMDKLLLYWFQMNKLYDELNDPVSAYINQEEWQQLKGNTMGASDFKWFIATVGYNYKEQVFYKFPKPGEKPDGKDYWKGAANNNQRTPVGVLEMMLYILFSWGEKIKSRKLKLKHSSLSLPNVKELANVLEKISIIK